MTRRSQRLVRTLGVGIVAVIALLGTGTFASTSLADTTSTPSTSPTSSPTTDPTATVQPTEPSGTQTYENEETPDPTASTTPPSITPPKAAAYTQPYGNAYPVTLETDFSRPKKAISSQANSDFSLLDDLERLIRGTYINPNTGAKLPYATRKANYVYMSISRMEDSHRVGRTLIAAAKAGVKVRVIHGYASQSKESRALEKALNASSNRDAHFKICRKGKSLACLSSLNGAIMHAKLLLINRTYDRNGDPTQGTIWSGSANLGGPSGERTWNNGLTVYNDKKLFLEAHQLWTDMYAERNVGNNYPAYVKAHATKYGWSQATTHGYTSNWATNGVFYSNLSHVSIWPTPIQASPTNGKDPVLNMLNRIVPDDQCRIRLQENRFKYRRIAVAQKLVQLQDAGCKVSLIAFEDDLKVNRVANCQLWIRVCQPILDTLRTADTHIEAAYAKPHDKTMLVDAVMKKNPLNPEEVSASGKAWPTRTTEVLAGSAALTGSNLVVSDEITTESTDPDVYDDYLQDWKAIWKSHEHHDYPY